LSFFFLISLSLWSTNSVVSGQPLCELNINCTGCLAQSGCGWCAHVGVCLATSTGAEGCSLLSGAWTTTPLSCPVETCANTYPSYQNCTACKVATGCGFCNLPGLGGLCRQTGFQEFCFAAGGAWNPKTCPTVPETCYINNTDCTACHDYSTEACGWCAISSTQGVCLRGSDGTNLCSVLESTWYSQTTACPAAATTAFHPSATTARAKATTGHVAATTQGHVAATTQGHVDATTQASRVAATTQASHGAATTASRGSTTGSAVTTPQTHTVDETGTNKPTEATTTGHISTKAGYNATVESSGMRIIGAASLVSSIAMALATWY